jgi:hypothetical protein
MVVGNKDVIPPDVQVVKVLRSGVIRPEIGISRSSPRNGKVDGPGLITKTSNVSYIEIELNRIGLCYGSRDREGAVIGINDVQGIVSSRDIDKVLRSGP